ncbi:polysaccharide deacetylase family protein [Halorubrum depositum]|uniref:polysaccharide deacetylase family protein n=1 Tax=Halorubrum depositum TaxID=2583992 RepID=UPI0011A9FFBE|nr:polysaccharide deacetylase family protein [Halorubrum depositum]
MNVLQVDVEPWYCDLPRERWDARTDRVVENVDRILAMLARTDNEATFFVLEDVARNHPDLIGRIRDAGHEIGSHGVSHRLLSELSPAELDSEIERSVDALRDAGVDGVEGFRAPKFSLNESTAWAIDVLEDRGFRYDSSIFPVKTPLYGVPDAPREPYKIGADDLTRHRGDGLWEVPLSAYRVPGLDVNVPVAGGFYLRALPYRFLRHALERRVAAGHPAVCYIHPWELDPTIPRVDEYAWFYYHRLGGAARKFQRLLNDFEFTTTERYLDSIEGRSERAAADLEA